MVEVNLDHVLTYDNITIVVLFIIVLMQWVVIGRLLSNILSLLPTLQKVALAINTLNERLHKPD